MAQISAYLDVILPKCFASNEFGVPVASNYKFAKKVARLNLNIIYLCLINGVPAEEIEATQSLHNLYLLYKYTAHRKPHRNKNIHSNEKLVEQLYELSKVSASAIDKVCPTSDDLLNSDDECRDKEKQKVLIFATLRGTFFSLKAFFRYSNQYILYCRKWTIGKPFI